MAVRSIDGGCGAVGVSYVGQSVVREHDGDWWYVTVPGLDDPLLAVKRGVVGMANATERWLPIVSDGQGELIAVADSAGELQGTVTGPEYDAGLWNSSGLTAHSHSFNPARWGVSGGIDTISTFHCDPVTSTPDSALSADCRRRPDAVAAGRPID